MVSQSSMKSKDNISSTFVSCSYMDCGTKKKSYYFCELQGKLRTMGKRACESGAATEGFMEEVILEVTIKG